jgi:hypothetical protein
MEGSDDDQRQATHKGKRRDLRGIWKQDLDFEGSESVHAPDCTVRKFNELKPRNEHAY